MRRQGASVALFRSRQACPEPFGYAQDKLRRREAKQSQIKIRNSKHEIRNELR